MLVTCFSTARSVTTSSAAIAELERPSAIRVSTSLRHTTNRVDEPFQIGHPVLEQVTHALRALGQKLGRVLLLDVLREYEHTRARKLRADDHGRLQPLVGVSGGHLDVDDRDVWLVCADLAQEIVEVAGLGDDLEAGVLEQAGDPRAKQEGIFGQHYAHGESLAPGAARRNPGRETRTDTVRIAARPA